jgi:hypothetical protein
MVMQNRKFAPPGRRGAVSGDVQLAVIRGGRADRSQVSMLESQVVHSVEGRVRLRIPLLTNLPDAGETLRAGLMRTPGVRSVRINVACASMVVDFDPRQLRVAEIQDWLSRAPLPPVAVRVLRARPKPATHRRSEAMVLAGTIAIGAATMQSAGWAKLLEELRQSVKLTDVLDLIFSGVRGDLRLALLTLGAMIVGRHLRATITRKLNSVGQLRDRTAPLELPVRRAVALAA